MFKSGFGVANTNGTWAAVRPLVFGTAAGVVGILAALYGIAAVIAVQNSLPEQMLSGLITVTLCLGAALSGFVSALLSGNRGMLYGAASGGFLAVIVIIAGVGAYNYQPTALMAVKFVMMLLCAAITGIFTVNRKKQVRF